MTSTPAPGRRAGGQPRSRGGRLDRVLVAAVVVPALTVAAALLADTGVEPRPVAQPPREVDLDRATAVCPAATSGGRVVVASGTGARGDVTVGVAGDDPQELALGRRGAGAVDTDDVAVVTGAGDLAPGLVALRTAGPGLRAVACPATSSEQWFTGVGAGAEHTSVLELTNPDAGPATVDVEVHGQSGPVAADGLRGVSVPGGETLRLRLGAEIPKREELALRVSTGRGRVAAVVVDAFVPIGRGVPAKEYLPGQETPAEVNVLMGLPSGAGERAVVVANGGDDVARVQLELVTARSVFAPAEVEEVTVEPGSVRRLSIAGLLGSDAAADALGLRVVSSRPVTATFRARTGADLVQSVPGGRVQGTTLVPVPSGAKELLLADADGVGAVRVEARSADGERLQRRTYDLTPEVGLSVPLPADAALVEVRTGDLDLVGSVLVETDSGSVVLPLRPLVLTDLVPAVRPGLP